MHPSAGGNADSGVIDGALPYVSSSLRRKSIAPLPAVTVIGAGWVAGWITHMIARFHCLRLDRRFTDSASYLLSTLQHQPLVTI